MLNSGEEMDQELLIETFRNHGVTRQTIARCHGLLLRHNKR